MSGIIESICQVISLVYSEMMGKCFGVIIMQEIKDKFKELINENVQSNNLLYRKKLKPYYKLLNDNKSKLKFYKYCNAEYYAIRNIEKGTLAFKKCSEFNDPFEGIALTVDENDKKYLDIIRDNAMITCLSEKKNDLLMFAHYADSFKGFCIEYDLSLLEDSIYQKITSYFFPVIYAPKPEDLRYKNILSEYILNHIKAIEEHKLSLKKLDDITLYFVHKAKIWEYENEWRFIVTLDQYRNAFDIFGNVNSKVILFKDFDCISSIYLGLNIAEDKKEHITEIVKRLNNERINRPKIKLYETSLNDKEYKIDEK